MRGYVLYPSLGYSHPSGSQAPQRASPTFPPPAPPDVFLFSISSFPKSFSTRLYGDSLLDEAKGFGLDGEQELGAEDSAGGVEGDVEAGDARVRCWEMVVISRSHCNTGHGLETFLTRWQGGTRHPEVDLHTGGQSDKCTGQ